MVFKTLNISGALLEEKQLLKHIEDIASNHSIKVYSDKNTYPIYHLNQNYKLILETYQILNEHLKLGIKIHSAGEWILDNFYIIEEIVKIVRKELSLKKYCKMIGIANGPYEGFARSYVLAEEIVSYTDGRIDANIIYKCLDAYQKNKMLAIDEIENFGMFLQISIMHKIKNICEKIFSSELQRFKAESIIERVIEKKRPDEQKFGKKFKTYNNFEDELKYSFIEYMSYRLKKLGKEAIGYQEVLEEEISKLGLNSFDVVQKEHLYIANLKMTMGNCIRSLRDISRINFGELLGTINGTETILNKDPEGTYPYMDQESKNYYKKIIERLSKRTKISEIYISEKIIELCNEKKDLRKRHVGYYLIDEGYVELINKLLNKKIVNKSLRYRARLYISSFFAISLLMDFWFSILIYLIYQNIGLTIFFGLFSLVPISEIVIRCMNYILSKIKNPAFIPKLDFEKTIPQDKKTFVIIPTILNSANKVKEMVRKLEVYFLANPQNNIYFALLGDVTESANKNTATDQQIIQTGLEEVEKLNNKYTLTGFNRFHFLYRERTWNDSEDRFIGWERKRGLITLFNFYIKKKMQNPFIANTIEEQKELLPDIKFIITLDSDTNLILNSASKLIGAMSHRLNIPVIENRKVVNGYGIMQPRIGLDLEAYKNSRFAEIYSIPGGIDFYSSAISDIYQDYFEEGIFTGKGIYDVDCYNEVLDGEIPENIVLSHDLLEGNYLRCALVTDCMLIDGYPSKYLSYIKRNDRWTRGDWQIIQWLKSNKLNEISKFKILDNLRRSLIKICSFILLFASLVTMCTYQAFSIVCFVSSILSITIMYWIDTINYILFKESNINGAVYSHKKFSRDLLGIPLNFTRMFLETILLPFEMARNVISIAKSFYRMTKKKKLLEWTTAEEGEKQIKNSFFFIYQEMFINLLVGFVFFILGKNNLMFIVIGIGFIVAPYLVFEISQKKKMKKGLTLLDKKYLNEIGLKTWKFFEDYVTEENHYLICDNYQEDRKNKTVKRTSSTNIGLELISVISSYDLGYISYECTIEYLKNIINTIKVLPKWNGHLYNWYQIDTLEPLKPRYISTVDSGNFVGYLYIVKRFLEEKEFNENLFLYNDVNNLILQTDFSKLFCLDTKLFSIGYNLEENRLTDSYYDFLASEARQASLVAIAKHDVPVKHWNALSRTITIFKDYKGLISWTGTSFEYLMPNINLKRYAGSLLDESSKFAILSQKEYCKYLKVPWGISESAYNLKDLNYNYQYKAFGVPWLGLKRGLEYDLVISPYSTFLALEEGEKTAMHNIKKLEKSGAYSKYGFFESIDYTSTRLKKGEKYAIVKTYMAHHQGLILNSINNVLNANILQKRFNSNPEIEAVQILLQERMPLNFIVAKEKKQKPERSKTNFDYGYIERCFTKTDKLNLKYHVISNENYKIVINTEGEGYSEYKNHLINRYRSGNELKQGMHLHVKNLKNNRFIDMKANKVVFSQDRAEFQVTEGALKLKQEVFLNPNKPVEIRRLQIENLGLNEELLEITEDFIPVLSLKENEYAHPMFNSMFIKFYLDGQDLIIERHNRALNEFLYVAIDLYTENAKMVDNSFEIDGEKYWGRNSFTIPRMILNSENFSNIVQDSIYKVVSKKIILKIGSNEKINVNFLISASNNRDEALRNLRENKSENSILKVLDISKIRCEEEMNYLQISSEDAKNYYEFLNLVLEEDFTKDIYLDIRQTMEINSLWKFGISGNLPIIVIKAKGLEDIDNIQEIIECYLYYRIKHIYIDLIIINEESNVYERFVRDAIDGIILDKQINYLKSIPSGIFILNVNEIEKEDLNVVLLKAKIVIDANKR